MFRIHLKKMEYKFPVLFFVFYFLIPSSEAFAQVKINEINWVGAQGNSYAEWVELYNDGTTDVNLKDSALFETGGTTQIIKLTKTISANGYYLIERVTPSSSDPVPGINDDSASFGGSGLSNSGEYLVLKDASGAVLDSLDFSKGWPAGDSKTYQTMQWSGEKWITATGTPKAINVTTAVSSQTATSSSDTISDSSSDLDSTDNSTSISTHGNPTEVSEKIPVSKFLVSAGRDRLVTVGAETLFDARLTNTKGELVDSGNVSWSFGDGAQMTGKRVKHVYKFPGTYAVVLNVSNNNEDFVSRANVTAVSPLLEVFCDYSLGIPCPIEVKNISGYELNLGEWIIEAEKSIFTFPKDTIVLSKKKILLPKDLTGIIPAPEKNIVLKSPSGEIVFKLKFLNVPMADFEVQPQSKAISVIISTSTMLEQLSIAEKTLNTIVEKTKFTPKETFMHSVVRANLAVAVLPREITPSSTIEIIEKPKSIIGTIIHLPVSAFSFIKNLFF